MVVLEKEKDLKWPADMYLEVPINTGGGFILLYLSPVALEVKHLLKAFFHGFVVDGKGMKMSNQWVM